MELGNKILRFLVSGKYGGIFISKGLQCSPKKAGVFSSWENKIVIKLSPIRCQPYQESKRSETN